MKIIIVLLWVFLIVAVTTVLFHQTQSFEKDLSVGERYLRGGNLRLAIPYLTSAFNRRPDDPRSARHLLRIQETLGNREALKRMLPQIRQRFPRDPAFLLLVGDYYQSFNDFEKAEELYRHVLALQPGGEVERKLADVLVWQKKYDEAISRLKVIAERDPADDSSAELLADVYAWTQQFNQSATIYRRLLSQGIRKKEILLKLADVLRFAGRNEEALELYDQYMANEP